MLQGIGIESTNDKINVSFDKEAIDEQVLLSWLRFLELELLSQNVGFSNEILDLSSEIKSDIWEKEKARLGIS
jgi:hypothetical protein